MGNRNTTSHSWDLAEEDSDAHRSIDRKDKTQEKNLTLEAPHKIFLWNAKGVYVDCAFPNPVHGHFFGGSKVRGACLRDFFSHASCQHILDALTKTLTLQAQQKVAIDMERQGTSYRTTIQLFPMHRHILGWVRDHSVPPGKLLTAVVTLPLLLNGRSSQIEMLTEKERQVIRAFGPGHSNRHIGEVLQMSDRTVRFHMTNLLRKLDLPSRAHLAHLRLFPSNRQEE